jgi:hypothetical protein
MGRADIKILTENTADRVDDCSRISIISAVLLESLERIQAIRSTSEVSLSLFSLSIGAVHVEYEEREKDL